MLSKLNKSNRDIKSFKSGYLTVLRKDGKIIGQKKTQRPNIHFPKKINNKKISSLVKIKLIDF